MEFISGPTCNPIVFGNLVVNPEYKTVLIYGHYDVQPSDQFDLTEKDGRAGRAGSSGQQGPKLNSYLYGL